MFRWRRKNCYMIFADKNVLLEKGDNLREINDITTKYDKTFLFSLSLFQLKILFTHSELIILLSSFCLSFRSTFNLCFVWELTFILCAQLLLQKFCIYISTSSYSLETEEVLSFSFIFTYLMPTSKCISLFIIGFVIRLFNPLWINSSL